MTKMLSSFQRRFTPLPVLPRRTLGRTGLQISILGLGMGGKSRLGAASGLPEKDQLKLLRLARDAGLNYFDTSELYENEGLLSQAFSHSELGSLVISSKFALPENGTKKIREKLETSLQRIGADHLDLYLAHAVLPADYGRLRDELVPELLELKKEGKVRFVGLSERFELDPVHSMLSGALKDDWWDVAMLGHSFLNPSAVRKVLNPAAEQEQQRGFIGIFAVRNVMSQPGLFQSKMLELVREGHLGPEWSAVPGPMPDLLRRYDVDSTVELGYRYAAHSAHIAAVMVGTGNATHLRNNIRYVGKGPLPAELLQELARHFGHLEHVSGS